MKLLGVVLSLCAISITSVHAMYLRGSYEGFMHKWLRSYYATIQDIAYYLGGQTDNAIEPRFNQIVANGGIVLCVYQNTPLFFGTPLGRLALIGGQRFDDALLQEAKRVLGLVEIIPLIEKKWGPVYAITKDIQGNSVPFPIMPYPFNVAKFAFLRIRNNYRCAFFTLDKQFHTTCVDDVIFEPLSRSEALNFWAAVKQDWQLEALLSLR